MEESAREGLLVDGADAPLAEEDSGSVELLDGTSVPYHAIVPENASALQRFHHRLSERSIYLRFFAAKPELSDREARYFTNVDRIDRFALVALDPERPEEIIGVVSFDREGTTERAEYAAEVEDSWQGRGVGLGRPRRGTSESSRPSSSPRTAGCFTCSGISVCPRGCATTTRMAPTTSRLPSHPRKTLLIVGQGRAAPKAEGLTSEEHRSSKGGELKTPKDEVMRSFPEESQPLFVPIFTEVPRIGILRSSP